jgi:hypothetical protein
MKDSEFLMQVLLYAAREYLTAFKNHVVVNLVKCIEKAYENSFGALDKKFTARHRCKVWRHFRGWMTREVGPGAENLMWADVNGVPISATHAALRAYVDRNLHDNADLPLDAAGGPNPTYVVEKR